MAVNRLSEANRMAQPMNEEDGKAEEELDNKQKIVSKQINQV